MADDPAAAIQRLEAEPNRARTVHLDADLRTVIAAAKRPPLTDATRERLIEAALNARLATGDLFREFFNRSVAEAVVDAILAEYAPVASTRERLVDLFTPFGRGLVAYPEHLADAVIKSGAVEDRAEVEAKALEAAADDYWADPRLNRWPRFRDWLRARAASIREGR